MFSAEGIGKNIEKAIENALFELRASREDVDIKILNEGGLFKKAKVLVTISEDAREKYTKHSESKQAIQEDEEVCVQEEKKVEPAEDKKEEKAIKKAEKERAKEEKKEEKLQEKKTKKEKVLDEKEFIKGLFEKAGKTVEITEKEEGDYITYCVEGEDLGEMIGHRGEAFYALQRLLCAVSGKKDKKILLDVGGYREKRKETLTELAYRTANKVSKTGRYVKLDPMNPSDRRIIHTALQNDNRVTTLSKGSEPHRYVIVFPKDDE